MFDAAKWLELTEIINWPKAKKAKHWGCESGEEGRKYQTSGLNTKNII